MTPEHGDGPALPEVAAWEAVDPASGRPARVQRAGNALAKLAKDQAARLERYEAALRRINREYPNSQAALIARDALERS